MPVLWRADEVLALPHRFHLKFSRGIENTPAPLAIGLVDFFPRLRAVPPPERLGPRLAARGKGGFPLFRAAEIVGRLYAIQPILAVGGRNSGAPLDEWLALFSYAAARLPRGGGGGS